MPQPVDTALRRSQVCDVVARIAAEQGFDAVTVRSVAASLGTSTTVVTHYFSSRSDLVRATIRREFGRFEQDLTAATAAQAGMDAVEEVVGYATIGAPAASRRFWQATVAGAHRDPALRAELDEFNAHWDARLDGLLEPLALDVRARERITDTISILVSGLVSLSFEQPDWPDGDHADLRNLIRDLLRAAAWDSSGDAAA